MNRLLVIALSLGALASTAGAQSRREVAIIGCRNAVRLEVPARRPNADSVRLSPETRVVEASRTEMEVRGVGRYHDRARLEWRPFIYDCTYNTRSAKTHVTVCFDSSVGTL